MNISKLKIDKTAGVYKVVIRIKFHRNIQYLIDSKKHCPASLSTMEMLYSMRYLSLSVPFFLANMAFSKI